MTLDSYRLIITKGTGGEYSSQLTYDGHEIGFVPNEDFLSQLMSLLDRKGLSGSNANRLEIVISGENLK